MPTAPAVTMQDLELEHAELLPSRETLSVHSGHSGGFSFAGWDTATPPRPDC